MKLFQLRAPNALILSGLAALAALTVAAEPASAQRRSHGSEITASVQSRNVGASLRATSQGAFTNAGFSQRARVPRGYDGGRYEWRYQKVWVAGQCDRVWEPAVYEWRYQPCGQRVRVCVRAGHWRTIQRPGYYETRKTRVWVPARNIQVGRDRGRRTSRSHRVSHVGRRYQ